MIYYKKGYKYQLNQLALFVTTVCPDKDIHTKYLWLGTNGVLSVKGGYAWDGPSGPTIDTPNFMAASLMHDALYQLFRMELLNPDRWRFAADQDLRRVCLERGMSRVRAWYVYSAVRLGARRSALPEQRRVVLTAP